MRGAQYDKLLSSCELLWVSSLFFGELLFLILVVLTRAYLVGLSYCPCNFLSFFKKILIFDRAGSSLPHRRFSSCRDWGLLSSWRVWVPSLAREAWALGYTGFSTGCWPWSTGSVAVVHRLSCSVARVSCGGRQSPGKPGHCNL